jgi:hemolysin III
MVTHIVGGAIGITAIVLCVVFAALNRTALGVVSGAIFGSTLVILYTMSSIYHGLSFKTEVAKKVFQILDHCAIFLLIAGTYTPIALVGMRSVDPVAGWVMFGIIWASAILGITLNAINMKRFEKFSMICYLVMGWCVVFRFDLLLEFLHPTGIAFLILGGISYTLGTIFLGLGSRHMYMHCIWHIYVLLGSVLHFLCIFFYLMR